MEFPVHPKKNIARTPQSYLRCTRCKVTTYINQMISTCNKCNGPLEYIFEEKYNNSDANRDSIWINSALIPLQNSHNIVSLGEGNSKILELGELTQELKGARLFIKLDAVKNPTGTFKDREASIIISRCKELHLDNLVFYSTGNTGRAYTHYAAHIGLTTYFFMPKACQYKNTNNINKNSNNFIISVDADYPDIGGYAKQFASENNLRAIAPLHDRTESYATLAYEQFQQMPKCDFFVQTIASGMGPIGFLRGHHNLIKFGLEQKQDMPRIVCVQSQETNSMYKAYNARKTHMTKEDLPKEFVTHLFEPTLNSTNPVNNYPDLYTCLKESNGLITEVAPDFTLKKTHIFVEALRKRNIYIRTDLEKSLLIGYAGIVRLTEEGSIGKNDRVLLLATGQGNNTSSELIPPDLVINLSKDDPKDVMQKLAKSS